MFKRTIQLFIAILVFAAAVFVLINYYGYIFAKTTSGKVIGVERVTDPTAIIAPGGQGFNPALMYSFAIAIQSTKGDITTGSSEDRQWAVVRAGQCAEAKFFPYPPWDLKKADTYHDVRLIRIFTCPPELADKAPETAPPADH